MKKDIFENKASLLALEHRQHYHTVQECEDEVKRTGHLLGFMDHVTETKVYNDGSGGNWSVFSWQKLDGWTLSSRMGIGPTVWKTRNWSNVVKYLSYLANSVIE